MYLSSLFIWNLYLLQHNLTIIANFAFNCSTLIVTILAQYFIWFHTAKFIIFIVVTPSYL